MPASQTFKKRQKERARQEKQAEKAKKKAERKLEPKSAGTAEAGAVNPADLFDENGEPRELDFHDF
jgi:hypothetical protein